MLSSYCEEENALSQTNKRCSRTCKKFKNNFSYNGVNPQQSISLGEKLLLQRDGDDLHVAAGLLSEETGHLDSNHKVKKNRKIKSQKLLWIFTFPMLVLSNAASTSSKMKNGAGQKLKRETQSKKTTHMINQQRGSNDHRMINFFIFFNTVDLII